MADTQGQAGPQQAGTFSIRTQSVTDTENSHADSSAEIRPNACPPMVHDVNNVVVQQLNGVRGLIMRLECQLDAVEKAGNHPSEAGVDERRRANKQLRYMFTNIGIQLAKHRQYEFLLERHITLRGKAAGLMLQEKSESLLASQMWRYVLRGGDLWHTLQEKLHLEDASVFMHRRAGSEENEALGMRAMLAPLYKPHVGQESRQRPTNFDFGALTYYSAHPEHRGKSSNMGWCHITGEWYANPLKPTAIIPFDMETNKLADIVFGSTAALVHSPANALLMRPGFHSWMKDHKFVIVPLNRLEAPVRRWRLDVICPDENNPRSLSHESRAWEYGQNIDGKELSFLSWKRPATKFLYFHFIISLVRIKDLDRRNWQQVWARYYQEQPFPAPSSYMRKSIIQALATHFSGAHMKVVESWMCKHGFESYPIQDNLVKWEIARRVHLIVLEESGK